MVVDKLTGFYSAEGAGLNPAADGFIITIHVVLQQLVSLCILWIYCSMNMYKPLILM